MLLIAGANGHVGRELVKRAAQHRLPARCFDMAPVDVADLGAAGLETVVGGITDPQAVRQALQGVDTVMFVIGLKRQSRNLTHEMVEHGGLKNVIEAGRMAGVKHIMYISALGVGSDAPALSLAAKWRAEQSLISSGIPYTIFRPSGYFVDFAEHFAPKIKDTGSFTIIGDGRFLLQPLDPADLAEAMLQSLDNQRVLNSIIKIAGPEKFMLIEIIELVGRVVSRQVKIKKIPFVLANFLFSALALVTGNRGGKDFLCRMSRSSVCTEAEMRDLQEVFSIEYERLEPWLRKQLGRQNVQP